MSKCTISASSDEATQSEEGLLVQVEKATCGKCARCWNYRDSVGQNEEHPSICGRCVKQLGESIV